MWQARQARVKPTCKKHITLVGEVNGYLHVFPLEVMGGNFYGYVFSHWELRVFQLEFMFILSWWLHVLPLEVMSSLRGYYLWCFY
jgi:hypothetical protein